MSKVPEFQFDYDKVDGMDVTEAMKTLMDQMAAHYNQHIKPAPITFGGVKIAPPSITMESTPTGPNPFADLPKPGQKFDKIIQMGEYEIKNGPELKLPEGTKILTGVSKDGVEIFDQLLNYDPADQIVTGDSGKYDLGRK